MTIQNPCCSCGREMPDGKAVASRGVAFHPEARRTVISSLDTHKADLHALSDYIHANPELGWEEVKAHAKLTSFLSSQGYTIENYDKYPTAFKVSYTRGSGGRVFGLNSEYDALPDLGHACGHNLIAICGVGAFLALRAAMDAHDIEGTIVLIGTPAEEGGSGKVHLYEIGAYDGIGACMMLHPGRATDGVPTGGAIIRSSALQGIEVEYTGKPAHAGLSPWEGVNALDASVVAYNSISALRQQLKPETRVQGIITDGGSAVNVIPARSTMSYQVRGASSKEVSKTVVKVESCFSGAATVTGCKHSTDKSEILDELRNERSLGTEWANVMQELYDAKVVLAFDETMGASTDFGNITHKLPACHPMFGIQTPPGAFNHTPEFTAGAGSQQGFDEAIKATTAMACVGVRYLVDDTFATQVRSGWEKEMKDMEKE